MFVLSCETRMEAAVLRERLADADVETFLGLSFEGVSLSPDEAAEADEAAGLFGEAD